MGPHLPPPFVSCLISQINAAREKAGKGEDDEDEFKETYLTDKEGDDDDDAASSLIEIPTGILSQYQREQLKKRRQLV